MTSSTCQLDHRPTLGRARVAATRSANTSRRANCILHGDALEVLKTFEQESVDCIITSPPYWGLRDYGVTGQFGLEPTLEEYLRHMLEITSELRRILKPTGTLWWNHGDSYGTGSGRGVRTGKQATNRGTQINTRWQTGGKAKAPGYEKSLMLQAHRLAIRMVDEQGWILRNQIVWHKPNVMPSSVKDRFTVDFEPVFFFTKSKRYHFEIQREPLSKLSIERVKYGWKSKKANASVMNGKGIDVSRMGERFANPCGRNKRTVWKISTSSSRTAHVAMFPERLIEPMVLAGCPRGGLVLDPFFGAGTTGIVAARLGRNCIGIELNAAYVAIARARIVSAAGASSAPPVTSAVL